MKVILSAFCFLSYMCAIEAIRNEDKNLLMIVLNNDKSNSPLIIRRLNTNELPAASPLLPGHSLIRPSKAMLKSAVNYPQEGEHLVYGNAENLGIIYDNTPSRVLNTGFRKGRNILENIINAVQKYRDKSKRPSLIVIQQQKSNSRPTSQNVIDKTFIGVMSKNKLKKKRQQILNGLERPPGCGSENFRSDLNEHWDCEDNHSLTSKDPPETLDEKTKRIQDFLNGEILVNSRARKEDTSLERAMKVNVLLKNLAVVRPLSLHEKTKYIEDFLNNKLPAYSDINFTNNKNYKYQIIPTLENQINEEENNANEMLDKYSSEANNDSNEQPNYRRSKKRKYRERDSKYETKESAKSDDSASSDYERNPGNPFTIHKNKYKQNWLWNHFMDGDHMNINPFGPPFANMGPSGADLFFGRKWWYYNQDDYKPMG